MNPVSIRLKWIMAAIVVALSLWTVSLSRAAGPLDTAKIELLTGATGQLNEKDVVFKVNVPRSDLHMTIAGVTMTPPLGLTSWAAFQVAGDQVMVMGDMVVLEDQANPVMDVALQQGLAVTALH